MPNTIKPVVDKPSIALPENDKWRLEQEKLATSEKAAEGAGVVMADCLRAVERGREYIDQLCDKWERREFEKKEEIDG